MPLRKHLSVEDERRLFKFVRGMDLRDTLETIHKLRLEMLAEGLAHTELLAFDARVARKLRLDRRHILS